MIKTTSCTLFFTDRFSDCNKNIPGDKTITGLGEILYSNCTNMFFYNGCVKDKDKLSNIIWVISEDNSPFLGCYVDQ